MTNNDRYAWQVYIRMECWRGTDALGNVHECVAVSMTQAAYILARKGVDVTTIHCIPFREASAETKEACIEESRIAYETARAESMQHYE